MGLIVWACFDPRWHVQQEILIESDVKERVEKSIKLINQEIQRIELGEKIQRGVALADFNGNGKDDIVCGTDDQRIYLIYSW